jgi:PilZ domain
MTVSHVPGPAGPGMGPTVGGTAPNAAERKLPAQRLPASRVTAITGVRLSPPGVEVTLVNISATGTLVECACRLNPGSDVTVRFDGTMDPPSVPGRVIRCSVAAIGQEGVLRYQVGIEFGRRIDLDEAPKPAAEPPEARPAAAAPAPPPPVLRNRW